MTSELFYKYHNLELRKVPKEKKKKERETINKNDLIIVYNWPTHIIKHFLMNIKYIIYPYSL